MLHVAIWTNFPLNAYMVPFCDIMLFICHCNKMVAIEKKKTKKDGKNNNNLHLIEPPWVYKPMPYSMSVLWSL